MRYIEFMGVPPVIYFRVSPKYIIFHILSKNAPRYKNIQSILRLPYFCMGSAAWVEPLNQYKGRNVGLLQLLEEGSRQD